MKDGKVTHKLLTDTDLGAFFSETVSHFSQSNLIVRAADAELKRSKSGNETLIGEAKVASALSASTGDTEAALESLERQKNYILRGDEPFLRILGISDSSGRIHDKKQGKFRQINRFLEHIGDIYPHLGMRDEITVYDLCCGKSYLGFAVYYYLREIKGRRVNMLCIDLKRDVISFCSDLARRLGFSGMKFVCDDVRNTPSGVSPDLVLSFHACDTATDIVIDSAIATDAKVILSTPCCHRYLNGKIVAKELSFVLKYPHLANKLCEAVTDSLRLMRMRAAGYDVAALELTDPEDTPKNTLLRGVRKNVSDSAKAKYQEEYRETLRFLLGDGADTYLGDIFKVADKT